MKLPLRVLLALSPALALSLGGCAKRGDASWQETLRSQPVLQNTARAFLTGQVYDRASIALRDGDETALQNAQDELQSVAPLLAAEQAVRTAIALDNRALREKSDELAATLHERAAKKYREALAIDPNFNSRDPELLNALGYFLAERGTSAADFQTSEKLTRRSLAIWDELVKEAENVPFGGSNPLLALRRLMRANTRDSLAWALYRQGEYKAAQKEQEAAVDEAARSTPQLKQPEPAELYYHLGEIYLALKKPEQAAAQFRKALELDPEHKPTQHALSTLPSSLRQPKLEPKVHPTPGMERKEKATSL